MQTHTNDQTANDCGLRDATCSPCPFCGAVPKLEKRGKKFWLNFEGKSCRVCQLLCVDQDVRVMHKFFKAWNKRIETGHALKLMALKDLTIATQKATILVLESEANSSIRIESEKQ